jgi:hypothetical protein
VVSPIHTSANNFSEKFRNRKILLKKKSTFKTLPEEHLSSLPTLSDATFENSRLIGDLHLN